jgi:signal transduction histidine kinase
VRERTERLRLLNKQLYEEIGRHESTEVLLRETQDYLNSIINSMPSVLIGVTREGLVTHWNNAATAATHIKGCDALGQSLYQLYPDLPVNLATIDEIIDCGMPRSIENYQSGAGSNATHMDLTIYPLMATGLTGAVIRIDDVTLRVRIETMMIQNEKMMSLGELAAGMAHELNNPLSAILHGVQNIVRRTSDELPANLEAARVAGFTITQLQCYLQEREIISFLEGIREAGERSARLVANMLEFSHTSSRTHVEIDIVNLLDQCVEMAGKAYELETPADAAALTIRREFASDLPRVRCAPAEIQQVILNLLRNASQSFLSPELGGPALPVITLRASERHGDLWIEIEDNGCGMEESVRKHVFEPFFTTKEVGQGTGLGLSVTYFIVTEHHSGSIEVESTAGKGSLFRVRLPLH